MEKTRRRQKQILRQKSQLLVRLILEHNKKGETMSANHKARKQIKQNISQMAQDILNELIAKVNAQLLKARIKIALKILRGKW